MTQPHRLLHRQDRACGAGAGGARDAQVFAVAAGPVLVAGRGSDNPPLERHRRHPPGRTRIPWTGVAGRSARAQDLLSAPRRRVAAAAARGPRLRVWVAADRRQFTVCGADRTPVWHAQFHPHILLDTDKAAAELAALQALWLAGKAREHYGAAGATVRLLLAYRGVVDTDVLDALAIESGLALELAADPIANPALYYRGNAVVIDWRSADLTTLIEHQRGTR